MKRGGEGGSEKVSVNVVGWCHMQTNKMCRQQHSTMKMDGNSRYHGGSERQVVMVIGDKR